VQVAAETVSDTATHPFAESYEAGPDSARPKRVSSDTN
jgi:hypothetical protein